MSFIDRKIKTLPEIYGTFEIEWRNKLKWNGFVNISRSNFKCRGCVITICERI